MTVIISTEAIKNKFLEALSRQIEISAWITPDKVSCCETTILSMLQKTSKKDSSVIVLSKYGKHKPEDFPQICIAEYLISIMYYTTNHDISKWIEGIKSYQENPPQRILVLGMFKPFYIKWTEKIYQYLKKNRYFDDKVFKYLPNDTTNIELSYQLSLGCALAIYVGHGRSRGWSGYRGFRWNHVVQYIQRKPIGTMISLSCSSLEQDKIESIPLGIKWVMEGRNCVFLGSTNAVKIKPLEEITNILLVVLSSLEVHRVDQLVFKMNDKIKTLNNPEINTIWSSFRLIGNPLQLL